MESANAAGAPHAVGAPRNLQAMRGSGSDDAPRMLDLTVFDGMPPASITRLASLFYRGDNPAGGVAQLSAIEAALLQGVNVLEPTFDHKLHQLAGSALQAGAALLGHTIRSYRKDPVTLATLENIREMRHLLDLTDREFQQLGYLPMDSPTQSEAAPPAPVATPPVAQACAFESGDPTSALSDEPLLDLSSYEGLPESSIAKLLSIFYCSEVPGSGSYQIEAINEMLLAPGADPNNEPLLYKLHQLAGSALQAGAMRLGKSVRAYREAATETGRHVSVEDLKVLRWLLELSANETRALGLLAP